ncbi:MAG: phospho-sugar mutase [Myxococcaceae bacterium]
MDQQTLERVAKEWAAHDPDPSTRAAGEKLIAAKDAAALDDHFGQALEFGTAGLRGTLGPGPNRMNRAVVRRTTAGLARYLKVNVPDAVKRGVVVGRDGRNGSEEFCHDVASVFCAEGFITHVFNQVGPTPLTAFALLELDAAAAVMVTASHNPPEYNGYKVYWGNGAQIVPPHDHGIAASIAKVEPADQVKLLSEADARYEKLWRDLGDEMADKYLKAIATLPPPGEKKSRGLKIVYTAMHGVGGRFAVEALARSGFTDVSPVAAQHEPDPTFRTVRFPNPEEKGALDLATELAEQTKADLVLANDPDADRLAVMARDAEGKLRALTGNELGVLLGEFVLTEGVKRSNPLVITTVVSSGQLRAIAAQLNAGYDETLTGFKWIANRALEADPKGERFAFGYEEALGYTVGTVVRDKDGIGAALVATELAARCQAAGGTLLTRLEQLQRKYGLFVSSLKTFTLPGAEGQAKMAALMKSLRAQPPSAVGPLNVDVLNDYQTRERKAAGKASPIALPVANMIVYELAQDARITVRPSGTEPKVKMYFEVKEPVGASEPMAAARARALGKLERIGEDFVAIARQHGLS